MCLTEVQGSKAPCFPVATHFARSLSFAVAGEPGSACSALATATLAPAASPVIFSTTASVDSPCCAELGWALPVPSASSLSSDVCVWSPGLRSAGSSWGCRLPACIEPAQVVHRVGHWWWAGGLGQRRAFKQIDDDLLFVMCVPASGQDEAWFKKAVFRGGLNERGFRGFSSTRAFFSDSICRLEGLCRGKGCRMTGVRAPGLFCVRRKRGHTGGWPLQRPLAGIWGS